MTRLLCLIMLPLGVLLSAEMLAAQSVAIQSNRSKLEQIKDFSLKGEARSEFKEFRRKSEYFGSIYVNRPERVAGSFQNTNSVELADYYARAACQVKSKRPQNCVLYARVKPRKYKPTKNTQTLSREANIEFKEYLRLQDRKRFGAFAASDNGAFGYSWAEASWKEAEQEALKRCSKSARKLMRKTPKLLRPIVATPSNHGCKLVHKSD
ncbi:hypothetical protein [Shimia sp. MMG029]|uniref:hypothetical protein n=1 Tax=Shimia sp. MMG029 TaxID=3021978 RepID=UPI0022FF0631|nr:hypothetical protein [Shimia sp. MMG029]MDA5558335.1 hypothetical protein [Shimia sp. MMG029]